MASEGIVISAQDLSEKYALACLMICDLVKSIDDSKEVQALTPNDIDGSFVEMISNGESAVKYVKKIVVEKSSQELH